MMMMRQYNLYPSHHLCLKRHPCLPKHCHRIPLIKIIIKPKLTLPLALSLKAVRPKQIRAQASSDITPKDVAGPKTFDPTKIIGFATPILVHNLGSANMVRKEGSIEVWQYRFGSCVVDFFFYPVDEGASQLILKTWDMRSTIMGDRLDRGSCRDEMNLYHHKLSSNS